MKPESVRRQLCDWLCIYASASNWLSIPTNDVKPQRQIPRKLILTLPYFFPTSLGSRLNKIAPKVRNGVFGLVSRFGVRVSLFLQAGKSGATLYLSLGPSQRRSASHSQKKKFNTTKKADPGRYFLRLFRQPANTSLGARTQQTSHAATYTDTRNTNYQSPYTMFSQQIARSSRRLGQAAVRRGRWSTRCPSGGRRGYAGEAGSTQC